MVKSLIQKSGSIHVYGGGTASSATVLGGVTVYQNGKAENTLVSSGGKVTVNGGGKAINTTIDNYGSMYLSSGAQADGAIVYYMGQLYVDKGAVLNNGTIRFGKTYISSGGLANNTVVSHGGLVFVSSGGKMETAAVSSGGWIHLYYGGHANNATVNGYGRFYVSNAASANKVMVNSNGLSFVYAGGKMENSTIQKGGAVHVYGAGTASNATITGGTAAVYTNGKIDNTVLTGGVVTLSSGATLRGTLQVTSGAKVLTDTQATVDFTVSRRTTADSYLINDISLINGAPNYTVTVRDNQETGVYKLAQGAENFNKSVTVGNGSANFGVLSVSGTLAYGGKVYQLQKNGSDLSLKISHAPAGIWDAVAGTSAEIAMPESASGCLFEESASAPSPLDDTLFADSNAADLTIWQTMPESSIGVSTLTESTQNINTKFELLA